MTDKAKKLQQEAQKKRDENKKNKSEKSSKKNSEDKGPLSEKKKKNMMEQKQMLEKKFTAAVIAGEDPEGAAAAAWKNEIEALEKKLAANAVIKTPVELEDADGETEICTPLHHEDVPADAICAILNPDPVGTGTLSTNRSAHQTGTPFAQLILLPDTQTVASKSCEQLGPWHDSLEISKLNKSTIGAMNGSNISVNVINTEPLRKKSMGSNVDKDIPKMENGKSCEQLGPFLQRATVRTRILSLTEKRLTSSFREHVNGDGPSKIQYDDNFSTQIWQLSISGNVPGWRKRRGETSSSYPWVRALMNTKHWDKVDPFSCQLRRLVGQKKKIREIHKLLETLRDSTQAPETVLSPVAHG